MRASAAQRRRQSAVVSSSDDESEQGAAVRDTREVSPPCEPGAPVAAQSTPRAARRRLSAIADSSDSDRDDPLKKTGATVAASGSEASPSLRSSSRILSRRAHAGTAALQTSLAARNTRPGSRRLELRLNHQSEDEVGAESDSEQDQDRSLAHFIVEGEDEDEEEGAGFGSERLQRSMEAADIVRCRCGSRKDEADPGTLWVQCSNYQCETWVHAACYGVDNETEVQGLFLCDACNPSVATARRQLRKPRASTRHGASPAGKGARGVSPRALTAKAELWAAAEAGEPLELHSALSTSPEWCSMTWSGGRTLLHRAAELGTLATCKVLLERVAPHDSVRLVRRKDADGMDALTLALQRAHMDVVALLLPLCGLTDQSTAVANLETGSTPLHAAAEGGCVECVRMLLHAAPVLRVLKDGEGATALHIAAGGGHAAVVRELLDAKYAVAGHGVYLEGGVHVGLEADEERANAAHYAAGGGHVDVLQVLAEVAPDALKTKDVHGVTPLHNAAAEGQTDAVRLLLSRGAKVHAPFGNREAVCTRVTTLQPTLTPHTPILSISKAFSPDKNKGWPPLLYADFKARHECVLAIFGVDTGRQLEMLGSLLRDDLSRPKVVSVVRSLAAVPAFFAALNEFVKNKIELVANATGSLNFLLQARLPPSLPQSISVAQ